MDLKRKREVLAVVTPQHTVKVSDKKTIAAFDKLRIFLYAHKPLRLAFNTYVRVILSAAVRVSEFIRVFCQVPGMDCTNRYSTRIVIELRRHFAHNIRCIFERHNMLFFHDKISRADHIMVFNYLSNLELYGGKVPLLANKNKPAELNCALHRVEQFLPPDMTEIAIISTSNILAKTLGHLIEATQFANTKQVHTALTAETVRNSSWPDFDANPFLLTTRSICPQIPK